MTYCYLLMLPEIPDNDTDVCWAPGCCAPVAARTESGLCLLHRNAVYTADLDNPTGHLWDRLGMRLNVLQESNGACLREPGPCDITLCRYHADDRRTGTPFSPAEPCAVKMGNRGGMTLEDVAAALGGCTRERARQLEASGLRSLRRACERAGIRLEDIVAIRSSRAA